MPRAKTQILIALGLVGVTMTAVRGQQTAKPSSLAAQDYLDIRQLANRYAYALDTGADKGYMYADLFTADGSFAGHKGRDDIAKFVWQHMPEQGPLYVKHFTMNHVIQPTSDGAIGQVYVIDVMLGEGGKESGFSLGGVYHDTYAKTPAGWRFKSRRFVGSKEGAAAVATEPALSIDPQPLTPASAKQPGHLSTEDRLEIQQLVNRYAYALDTGGGNGAMYSHLFSLDGVFGRSVGREAIEKMAWQHMPEQGPLYAKHFLANHVIEPTATGAIGKEYVLTLAIGDSKKPTAITTGGIYDDVYERTAEGWRFKTRRFVGAKAGTTPGSPEAAKTAAVRSAGSKASKLGPSDYLELQQLAARSAYAVDNAADGSAFADLFVADGTMSEQGKKYQRREQLAEFARGAQRPSVFHFITNQVVDATPDGATAKTYVASFKIGETGQPNVVGTGGRYEDVYVRTGDGWRIKSRTSVASKAGPQP